MSSMEGKVTLDNEVIDIKPTSDIFIAVFLLAPKIKTVFSSVFSIKTSVPE
ncbi:MAG: hypothetical protein LBN39_03010 [Planctomycetaceae bacterium]|jgi:hypothetical protein|nr:hypothetical protein [Planctomycetaceae bacterium]